MNSINNINSSDRMPKYTATELDLSERNLTKLPDNLVKYKNLVKLVFIGNKITTLNYIL